MCTPHRGFAAAIFFISDRISALTLGLPTLLRWTVAANKAGSVFLPTENRSMLTARDCQRLDFRRHPIGGNADPPIRRGDKTALGVFVGYTRKGRDNRPFCCHPEQREGSACFSFGVEAARTSRFFGPNRIGPFSKLRACPEPVEGTGSQNDPTHTVYSNYKSALAPVRRCTQ